VYLALTFKNDIINSKRQKINSKQIAKSNNQNPNSLFLKESCIKKKKAWILEIEIWILFGFCSLSFGLSNRIVFVTKTMDLHSIVLVYLHFILLKYEQ